MFRLYLGKMKLFSKLFSFVSHRIAEGTSWLSGIILFFYFIEVQLIYSVVNFFCAAK